MSKLEQQMALPRRRPFRISEVSATQDTVPIDASELRKVRKIARVAGVAVYSSSGRKAKKAKKR